MTIEDFEQVYKLWKRAGLIVENYKKEKEGFEMLIKYNPENNFLISDENKVSGCVMGTFNGRRAWVYHLAVDPSVQNKGWGKALMNKVEESFKKIGGKRVLLGVFKENSKALGFYKKVGYTEVNDAYWLGKNI